MIRIDSTLRALSLTLPLWCMLPARAAQASGGPETSATGRSVTYQVNAFHDGDAKGCVFAPPLSLKWSKGFAGRISYPLVVAGRIFVTEASTTGYGTILHALDVQSGQNLWSQSISGTYFWSGAAYDEGRVFVLNFDGLLRAFDEVTGNLLWQLQLPGQYAFSSPPTAVGGVVYAGGAGSGGTVYAVDEATQAVLWTQSVANGDHSAPVVAGDSVFVSYACPQTYALERATGAVKWHYSGSCSGGGGKTAVFHGGLLYVRDVFFASENGAIFDARSGNSVGTFQSQTAPAFEHHRGYFVDAGLLTCRSLGTGQLLWSFVGDGNLVSAPLVANGSVYVGSSAGNLYALETTTGALQWSTNLGASIAAPDEHNVSQPLTGFGAGFRVLVVPAGNQLFVLGS